MAACVLVVYLALIYGTYVPDWQFTIINKDSADYGKVFNVSHLVSIPILSSRNFLLRCYCYFFFGCCFAGPKIFLIEG